MYITTLVIIVILVLVAPPTGPGSNSLLVLSLPVWVWQHSSCPTHVSNNHWVDGGAHTHHPAVSFTGNPSKRLPTAHQSRYGPLSAASLNCLVSPSHWELKPYPQSSLYNLCLIIPSPAVHLISLRQHRFDHHYSGRGKYHCIPPCHCWSILQYHSTSDYSWIWFPRPSHMSKLL